MLALEEKNNLSNDLQSTKKKLEEIGNQKVGGEDDMKGLTFNQLCIDLTQILKNISSDSDKWQATDKKLSNILLIR